MTLEKTAIILDYIRSIDDLNTSTNLIMNEYNITNSEARFLTSVVAAERIKSMGLGPLV